MPLPISVRSARPTDRLTVRANLAELQPIRVDALADFIECNIHSLFEILSRCAAAGEAKFQREPARGWVILPAGERAIREADEQAWDGEETAS